MASLDFFLKKEHLIAEIMGRIKEFLKKPL
jgi:hypothetical protein